MFFRRSFAPAPVAVGQSFRRRRSDDRIETAQVLDIREDGFGIPHVRYELTVEQPLSHAVYTAGTKVLALSAFTAAFRETPG
jgi:hypothetical protein